MVPRRRLPHPRRYWVRRDLTDHHRLGCSHYYALLEPHREMNDHQGNKIFHNYTCISGETFMFLPRFIEGRITKKDTTYRTAIPAGLKLVCTLRFLATRDSLH